MAQFHRLGGKERAVVHIQFEGQPLTAREGDTVLTAILTQHAHLGASEPGERARAGFCLMGACQDCWVWLGADRRVRACTTLVAEGMSIHPARPD
jgi:predicted molibdopterin-dependent oxidoreductase YjgC